MLSCFARLCIGICTLLSCATVHAEDWPQWRGAQRDGTSAEKGLKQKWPKEGPSLLWNIKTLGSGFSGPAVVGERVFIMGSEDDSEYLAALGVGKGNELWRVKLGPIFKNDWGDGPRGTPTVAGDRVVALGAQGVLVCVELTTGKEHWRTDLRKDHAGQLMKGNIWDVDWGYSESPLVDDGKVIVSPGGSKGIVAAFELATGKQIWRTATIKDTAGYSSIVAANIHGTRHYVQLTGGVEFRGDETKFAWPRVIGIAPKDGNILWQHKINYNYAGVINTPVVLNDIVYTSCGYGAGCTILRIDKDGAGLKAVDITKESRKVMVTYHGGIVPAKDRVFGFTETQGWVCQKLPSGESLWEDKRKIRGGSHIRIGNHFIIVTLEGAVAMTEPNDDGWTVQGDFILPNVSPLRKANSKIKVCTQPVVGNGRLYIRDQENLYCYDLR